MHEHEHDSCPKCASLIAQMRKELNELQSIVRIDALSELFNRRHFDIELEREVESVRRNRDIALSLAILDIDTFKSINDTYGHAMGDRIIRSVSDSMRAVCRKTDILFRIGGEEFGLILPHTDIKGAKTHMERLCDYIGRKLVSVQTQSGESVELRVTVSIGVMQYVHGMSVQNFFSKTDKLLYISKEEGRNRVSSA